jgi:replication factor C subunit 1
MFFRESRGSGTAIGILEAIELTRASLVDSDDDEDDEPAPEKTPVQKVAKKAPTPKKEEKVEASNYFSSIGKNKVSRTVPVREARPKKIVAPLPKEENYLDDDDDADDIYAEAFQKKDDDEYKEEPMDEDEEMDDFVALDEDEEEDVKPKRRAAAAKPAAKPAAKVAKSPVKPAAAAKPVAKSPAKTTRRRKPVSNSEDEDDDFEEAPPAKEKASPAKKPPAKKPRAPAKKKEEDAAPSEVQALHDAIPTVRAPTPPPRDPSKKFNFYAQAAKPPPVAQGSKVVPTGADNCLAGLTFVFTGILESLSREDGQQLVKKYGGKVTTAPSKKTSYVVLGSEAGPKKLETIHNLGIKTINEDGLFMLIKTLPSNGGDGKAAKEWEAKKALEEKKIKEMAAEMEKAAKADAKAAAAKGAVSKDESQLWTSKYAPARMGEICGNKGQVEKLQKWLQNWAHNHKTGFKMRGADGSGVHRAVMIHGPPGIGKTTAAHLVAKLEGYDVLEYNASDTRSKKLMEETMWGVLDNKSLMGYFAADKEKVAKSKEKLLLVMDEVDGMSAGDRGGVGQLAAFCRKTNVCAFFSSVPRLTGDDDNDDDANNRQVPIICICNERKLPKMKPFDNVTFDLGFRRPDANAIRSRIASIAFREGMKLPANVIDQLVEGTRADIRQIINMLSTYKTTATTMTFDESKDFTKSWEKHVVFKPWDIASKLLGTEMFGNTSRKTLNDKIELYFNDHEFSYLMVQENYLKQNPDRASGSVGRQRQLKILELADEAAMSISDGDLCDAMIHGTQQHWSLMPVHGMFSTVMPASKMYGSYGGGQMSFTSWLGNNSKQGMFSPSYLHPIPHLPSYTIPHSPIYLVQQFCVDIADKKNQVNSPA